MNDTIQCMICGCTYVKNNKEDEVIHNTVHKKYLDATEKYPFMMTYHNRETIKNDMRDKLKDNKLSVEQKMPFAIRYLQAYFSRSYLASDNPNNHVSFEDYVAMLLNQGNTDGVCRWFEDDLYNLLVLKFTKKSGIDNFDSYYK